MFSVSSVMRMMYKPSSSHSQHFSECSSGWSPVQTPPGLQTSASELHVHWGLTPLCSTKVLTEKVKNGFDIDDIQYCTLVARFGFCGNSATLR